MALTTPNQPLCDEAPSSPAAPDASHEARGKSGKIDEAEAIPIEPTSNGASATNEVDEPVFSHFIPALPGERFLAYVADIVVTYCIVLVLYTFSGALSAFGHGFLSGDPLAAKSVAWIVFFSYMVLSVWIFHTTVGKYVFNLQVASLTNGAPRKYPSLMRVVVRETVGRIVSSLFFGIGYWKLLGSSPGTAWSDDLASTTVIKMDTRRSLRRALTGFVIIALFAEIGATVWGYSLQQKESEHGKWLAEISSESKGIQKERQTAASIINRKPHSLKEWQQNMRDLDLHLDRYEAGVDQMRETLLRGRQDGLPMSDEERRQVLVLLQVCDIRKQQILAQHEEAKLVMDYEADNGDFNGLLSSLRMLDRDVESMDHKASRMLTGIGID